MRCSRGRAVNAAAACCRRCYVCQVVEEEEEELVLSWVGCFVWLSLVTVFISLLSDYIMDAITGEAACLFEATAVC